MQWKIFLCILVFPAVTNGYLFDDPCDVFPSYSHQGIPDSDFVTDTNVPTFCTNGTFRWDYPRGTVMLHFHNIHQIPTAICIRDSLGGGMFTITDKTSDKQLGDFTEKLWTCTDKTRVRDIILQVVAPELLTYMGQVEYKITQ